jgi:hypothetical protein
VSNKIRENIDGLNAWLVNGFKVGSTALDIHGGQQKKKSYLEVKKYTEVNMM